VGVQPSARRDRAAVGAVVTFTIHIKDLPATIANADTAMRQAISYGARAGAERGRTFMVPRTPRDLGQLAASWRVKPYPTIEGLLAELINDAPTVAIVELGARPHTVNPQGWAAIYEWARRHMRNAAGRLRPRPRTRVQGPLRPFWGPDPEVMAFTNAIVWKIRRYGQQPTFFIRNSIPTLVHLMATELGYAIDRALANARKAGA
jgi:hypothetical protein